MTPEEIEDEAARPRAPAFTLTPFQELNGRGLAAIHRWYLRDLSAVGALMGDIRAGLKQPGELAPAVRGMPMAQNLRLFGTACGASCKAITTHHQIEDFHLYPQLEVQGNEGLNAVLARLRAEHRGLEHLIEQLRGFLDHGGEAVALITLGRIRHHVHPHPVLAGDASAPLYEETF